MKISIADSQNFCGKAFVVGNNNKTATKIAHELNKMNVVKNAKCNFYLAYGNHFFDGRCVKVFAKSGSFNFRKDYPEMYHKGEYAVLSLDAVKSAVERAINSYNKK